MEVMNMIRKQDLCVKEMPEQTEKFELEKKLDEKDIQRLKDGYEPYDMDDKWCTYFEDGKLHIHRSWTGICIYIVELSTSGKLNIEVNRDQSQYRERSIEKDRQILTGLLNWFKR